MSPRTIARVAEALVGLLRRCNLPTIHRRNGGRSTKHDLTCLMTARCASATNPVAPGTASVIPPRLTQPIRRRVGVSALRVLSTTSSDDGPSKAACVQLVDTDPMAVARFPADVTQSVGRFWVSGGDTPRMSTLHS